MPASLVRRSPVHTGRVVATEQLSERMRRVTLRCDAMLGLAPKPAQDVEVHLLESTGRRVKRRYTIRHARAECGELDLDVLLHGEGPGAAWGARAKAGDEVHFQGPRGKLELTSADWHLLCGDESALPAIAAVCEALPDREPARAVIEVRDEADQLPVRADVCWVHRNGHPPGTSTLLQPALAALELPRGSGHGYLMGETRSVVALRADLERRGLAHESIFVKGYWNLGRPDRIAGRAPGKQGSGA